MLEQYKLDLPMFSSGSANINTGDDAAVVQMHINNAKFVKALGGENIQITNSSRPKTGAPTTEDLKKYGQLLNEIGKRTLEIGVQTNYHNHMGQLGQTPEEVKLILENAASDNVKFLLDVAHYHQGGGILLVLGVNKKSLNKLSTEGLVKTVNVLIKKILYI